MHCMNFIILLYIYIYKNILKKLSYYIYIYITTIIKGIKKKWKMKKYINFIYQYYN